MPYYLGIDIGTGTIKGVLLGDNGASASHTVPSGINYEAAAEVVLAELLTQAKTARKEVRSVVASGAGSSSAGYRDRTVSELLCCARGVYELLPQARTVIDIEGQITQVFRLGKDGKLMNFVTGEKCAGGSGRFLDIISNVLQIPLEELGPLSLKSTSPVTFTTSCAVFGESEAVSRIAEGTPPEDILAGINNSIAARIATMIEKLGMEKECAAVGGGALNTGLIKSLEEVLKTRLIVPPEPQMVTALGAALLARDSSG